MRDRYSALMMRSLTTGRGGHCCACELPAGALCTTHPHTLLIECKWSEAGCVNIINITNITNIAHVSSHSLWALSQNGVFCRQLEVG